MEDLPYGIYTSAGNIEGDFTAGDEPALSVVQLKLTLTVTIFFVSSLWKARPQSSYHRRQRAT